MTYPNSKALTDPKQDIASLAVTLPVLDVLERLGNGESFETVLKSTDLAEDELRACFQVAASVFRRSQGLSDGACRKTRNPVNMSLAEALETLAAFGMSKANRTG